ncbi:hypothetical protein CANTEDRAFT_100922 [Yamadazyma tenuis ATCC 10573]|uniref:Uncharacterized protein n=1 Tax=Candida tenuis (strain ATCC 10573 / BCRC 21748 / CBS 615 / JCM 9827 / NBRC 10315 / NRRL Y-1498 / VKM Y-70) TaxID=590646 RepID=G3AWR4_CANTC|nr:uncharacterized protein CANTEDRAFT_100922 [Yamadazyma tenuis ATCC 10573]EGV66595.1 hypothetical protein CANTEDRAFT_100922 [Yamadazyma tenuis ATCC 10573]
MDHTSLLVKAKQHQRKALKESETISTQLQHFVETAIRHNSRNDVNGSTLLDKITTIHLLDKEINNQLNNDIAVNFERLSTSKADLERAIRRTKRRLEGEPDMVSSFQSCAERIDQDLRILKQTLHIVEHNQDKK